MTELEKIKRHVDGCGFASAIVGDHVAIGLVWTTRTCDGKERRRELTERAHTFEEACGIIGFRRQGAPAKLDSI